jgi:hypothetical protein
MLPPQVSHTYEHFDDLSLSITHDESKERKVEHLSPASCNSELKLGYARISVTDFEPSLLNSYLSPVVRAVKDSHDHNPHHNPHRLLSLG